MKTVLLVAAIVCFILVALGVSLGVNIGLLALGLAFLAGSLLL